MRAPTFPWQRKGRRAGFITRRLRHLIIIPYLVLATLLALTITYLITSAAQKSLTERFQAQLLDAVQRGTDSLSSTEVTQLAALRDIAFTTGFSDALARQDSVTMSRLAEPRVANDNLDKVVVVSSDGTVVLVLTEAPGKSSTEINPELNTLIMAALNPQGSLDKVSGAVEESKGDAIFYTAGPVRQGDTIVGAILVGNSLSHVLRQVARESLSDGATLYEPDGTLLGHTQTASREDRMQPLTRDLYKQVVAAPNDQVRTRSVTLGNESYVEVLGSVPRRTPQEPPPGVFGVMLRTEVLDARLQDTLLAMLPIFVLAMALTVLIGLILASWIDRPLMQLMVASARVARGDLEAKVPVTRNDELGVLSARFNDMVDGLRQLFFVKDLFGRFVSREVSAKLLAGEIELGGEQREVTILFSDLRDFTRLSEERSPTEIVDLLNEHFRNIVRAAARHGGIVNKFGGDSTMIIFGAPVAMPDHADRALATALEMDEALTEMRKQREAAGWKPLHQGIGINTGMVVAGQIGSEDRMEYTVIGDAVNVASRLQAVNKMFRGCDIVFSESTLKALANPEAWVWESRGRTRVRGKQEDVGIYSLLGRSEQHEAMDEVQVADLMLPSPAGHVEPNEPQLEASSISV